MKIAFLIQSLSNGGAERVVANLSKSIGSQVEHEIILYYDEITYSHSASRIVCMGLKRKKTILGKLIEYRKAKKRLKKIKKINMYDVVVSFLSSPNSINIKTNNDTHKCIVSVRSYLSGFSTNKLKKILEVRQIKKIYNKADHIVACAKDVMMDLIENYNLKEDKCSYLYNPLMLNEIDEVGKNLNLLNEEDFNIINVGRLDFQKGQWHLINCMPGIIKNIPNAKLHIFGVGNLENVLKNKIVELGLSSRIILHGFKKNIYEYLKVSDLSIVSSLQEGIANFVTESFALGVPVVSVDCKSGPLELITGDIVENINSIVYSKYGVLVPRFENIKDYNKTSNNNLNIELYLIEAVSQIANDVNLLKKYSELGLERAKDFCNIKITNSWIKLINR